MPENVNITDTTTGRFLDYLGLGFVLTPVEVLGTEFLAKGAWPSVAAIVYSLSSLVAGALFLGTGLNWYRIKPKLGPRMAGSVGAVANDLRYWIAGLVIFVFGPGVMMAVFQPHPVVVSGHYLSTGEAEDSYFEGRPLGIWWDGSYLNLTRTNDPEPNLFAMAYFIRGKNLGAEEVTIDSAYLTSAVDGSKLPLKINALPGGWIDISAAGPVPVHAEFSLQAEFEPPGRGLSEENFMKRWDGFYVVIQAGSQKIRHEVTKDDIDSWFNRNHPERAPHVAPRKQ